MLSLDVGLGLELDELLATHLDTTRLVAIQTHELTILIPLATMIPALACLAAFALRPAFAIPLGAFAAILAQTIDLCLKLLELATGLRQRGLLCCRPI